MYMSGTSMSPPVDSTGKHIATKEDLKSLEAQINMRLSKYFVAPKS